MYRGRSLSSELYTLNDRQMSIFFVIGRELMFVGAEPQKLTGISYLFCHELVWGTGGGAFGSRGMSIFLTFFWSPPRKKGFVAINNGQMAYFISICWHDTNWCWIMGRSPKKLNTLTLSSDEHIFIRSPRKQRGYL